MLEFRRRAETDEKAVLELCGMGLPQKVAELLVLRGITNQESAEKYLHPSLDQLYDPYLLGDMAPAVKRINEAKEKKERVVIYGDYDTDGVTSTSLLLLYFRSIGINCGYYIPDRHEEGYGLNVAAVKELAKHYDLMVTVDCGVTAVEEVRLAKSLGLDVVVTDHHHADSVLPDCLIIDPRLHKYPFPYLAGVGVAAKLVQAMGGLDALKPYLDIVAIGTVADIVSLTDENRALVQEGLRMINRSVRPGLLALMETAGLRGKELNSSSIGFALGPRINAGGRIGHSSRSVEMICTNNMDLAREIASELENHNQIRQAQESAIMQEALAQIESTADFIHDRALIVSGENWNAGVIGIVASRLVERYHRPVFVLAREKETYVGSARSIKGVPLFDLMQRISDVFLRYGGHDMAAGLTVEAVRLEEFSRRINDQMLSMEDECWIPTQEYDMEIRLPELTMEFFDSLSCMQPTGQGNGSPVFLLRGVQVSGARTMGANGAHLKMQIAQDRVVTDAAAFKMGWCEEQADGLMDMLITIDKNEWMGKSSLRIYVKAFRPSDEHYEENLMRTEEKHLAGILPDVLRVEDKPRFRRYLPLKEENAEARISFLLKGNLSGTLLLYTATETALVWEKKLRELGLYSRIGCGVGTEPNDRCAYNLMTGLPNLNDTMLSLYKNIVFLDGVLSDAQVEHVLNASPGTVIQALPKTKAAIKAIADCMPPVELTREVYKALRASSNYLNAIGSLQSTQSVVGRAFPVPLPQLYLSLCALRDMELVEFDEKPFRIRLCRVNGKKDFYTTVTYLAIQKLIG